MKLHTKTLLASLTASALLAGSAHAASVLFVDSAASVNASWQSLIESDGHTYTLYNTTTASGLGFDFNPNTAPEIAYMNSFDVIVISGSNANFGSVRNHGASWNTLETPMINLGNYLASGQFSSSSWQWTTPGTGGAPNASGDVDVLDVLDPIWAGVTLTPGAPPTVDLYDANAGHLSLGTNSLRAGITLVAAQSSNNGVVAIAHADPGALRTGSQEQYFIASFTGSDGTAEPFSAAGEQVFLNAINTLVPEPSSLALLGLGGLLIARRRRD